MPKINVYLPDDLAAAVKSAGIPISPVCQKALADAVRQVSQARKVIEQLRNPDFDPHRFPQIARRISDRMTVRALNAIQLGREASGSPPAAGTALLLIGMLDEGGNLAIELLQALGVDTGQLREAVSQAASEEDLTTATSEEPSDGEGPAAGPAATDSAAAEFTWSGLTFDARTAIASALAASIDLGHNYIGSEHLLLGLLANADSAASRVMRDFGVDQASAKRAVTTALAGYTHARGASVTATGGPIEIMRRLEAIEARLDSIGA